MTRYLRLFGKRNVFSSLLNLLCGKLQVVLLAKFDGSVALFSLYKHSVGDGENAMVGESSSQIMLFASSVLDLAGPERGKDKVKKSKKCFKLLQVQF